MSFISSNTVQSLTPINNAIVNQNVYLVGSGNQALSAAGNFRIVIENPVGSAKILHIFKLDSYSSAAGFGELLVGAPGVALAGLPTTARTINNVYFGSANSSVAKVFADTNLTTALSGGIDSGISIGVSAGTVTSYLVDIPELQLQPGFSLGINVPFTGAANVSLNLFWYEQ